MTAAFELLTNQERKHERLPGGTLRTTMLEQLAKAPTEGELLLQCHGTQKVTYKEGDVFWEPGIDRPHLLAANPSSERRTRFLAICIGVPGEPVTRVIKWPVEG